MPSHQSVQDKQQRILELLQINSEVGGLNYKELQALNVFLLQLRLNTRSGPIMSLKWEDLSLLEEKEKENGGRRLLTTNRHKTGTIFDLGLYIEKDQRPYLENMKQQFVKEYPQFQQSLY